MWFVSDKGKLCEILLNFIQKVLCRSLAYFNETFLRTAKVVDISGVDIEPQGVDVNSSRADCIVDETITGNMLKLLQSVELLTKFINEMFPTMNDSV